MSKIAALLIAASLGLTPVTSIHICVVGDNLIHSTVVKAGATDTGYDYNYMYDNVSQEIQFYDLAILNQETPIVDKSSGYTGYPLFGSPKEIGDAVINAGFDVVTCATNHTIDKGTSGLKYSYDYWKSQNIPALGVHERNESPITYYTCKGIRLAMLNYTYGLNGLKLPADSEYIVDLLDDKEAIKASINEARANSDFVIVFAHWGTEYVYEPTSIQREWGQFLADAGANLIVGTHPHVIEPQETLIAQDGHEVPVYWSLGNFLSGQDEVPRMLGALADITLVKVGNEVRCVDAKAIPTVTHISSYSERFQVYFLKDYTEDLASKHRLRRVKGSEMSLGTLNKLWSQVYEKKN